MRDLAGNQMRTLRITLAVLMIGGMCFGSLPANAQVGDTVLCVPVTGTSTHDKPLSTNVEAAQTFEAPSTFTLTAVKLPLQRNGSPTGTFTLRITDTTTEGEVSPLGSFNPSVDTDVTHSSVSINKSELPEATGLAADQDLSCDPDDTENGYVVELTTPVVLTQGIVYAIVVDASSTPGNVQWGISLQTGLYADGQAGVNDNVENEGVPEDWALYNGGAFDSGFALYSNVITPDEEGSIDTWFRDYLSQVGLNDINGKTLFFAVVMGALSVILTMNGWRGLIVMALMFLIMTVFAGEEYISAAIYLATVALMFIGVAVGWLILRGRDTA